MKSLLTYLAITSLLILLACEENDINVAEVVSLSANAITSNSAELVGSILTNGGTTITKSGMCWSTDSQPTVELTTKTEDGTPSGAFTSKLNELSPGIKYYVRAYAINKAGIAYGNEITFTTLNSTAKVTTTQINGIEPISAKSGGSIISNGGLTITAVGVCWSTVNLPSVALDTKTIQQVQSGTYESIMTALQPGLKYYVRSYATNNQGTSYGEELSFTTPAILPQLTTTEITGITSSMVSSGGNIINDGGASITSRGVTWSTQPNPIIESSSKTTDGFGTGTFSSSITELLPGTSYYVRAYATNDAGTGYGNQLSLVTTNDAITDFDGNAYGMVKIGIQFWMSENLKTSHYNDGSAIPNISDFPTWSMTDYGVYGFVEYSAINNTTYGKVYNHYAVTDSRKLCPIGTHVPSNLEWATLINYLGEPTAADKLKEIGTQHWPSGSSGTDDYNFKALPGGSLMANGYTLNFKLSTGFWTSETSPMFKYINWNSPEISSYAAISRREGYYVRCIKN